MPNPSRILRDYAEQFYEADDPRRAQVIAMAEEFERQHVAQNNALTVALGQAELALELRIEQMAADLRHEIAALTTETQNSSARQQQMLAMLEELQTELRAIRGDNQHEAGGTDTGGDGR